MSRRIRSLKPEIIEDEKVGPLGDTAFRLFTAMITIADDYGNVRADARWLQAQIWWAHPSPPNVLPALVELVKGGLIEVYGVRGGTYAHLRGWEKHQRVDNAGKNKVPTPKDPDALVFDVAQPEPLKLAASRGEIPLDGMGEEGKGEDMSGKPDAVALFASAAVGEINRLASTSYRPETSFKLCRALVKAKHTPEEAVRVVRSKREWLADEKMRQYFRPATLLSAKFANYLADIEAGAPVATGKATSQQSYQQSTDRADAVSPLMLAFADGVS